MVRHEKENKYVLEKVELSPIEKIMFGHMRSTI